MKTKHKIKIIFGIFLFTIAIVAVSLALYNKSEMAAFDNSNPHIDEVTDNEISLQLHIISGNKDSVFCAIEQSLSCFIDSTNYSYEAWSAKTEDLYGTGSCTHDNDYDYLNHECNIIDYLNWHLTNKISQYENKTLSDGILTSIELTDSLRLLQYDLIEMILGYDTNTIYDGYGLSLEYKQIINDNLKDLYFTLSENTIEKRRITQIDKYPFDCPTISDDIVDMVYQRFITEYIQNLDCQIRNIIQSKGILYDELAIWESFMAQRQKTENELSGKLKDIWAYNTKVWKLNRVKQLKNEFSSYGTMCELDYTLSLQDCNYTELMIYHSLSKAWEDYDTLSPN